MDFNQAELLLNVVRMARDYPSLPHIHNAAMRELEKMNKALAIPEPAPAPPIPSRDYNRPQAPAQTGEGPRIYPAGTHNEPDEDNEPAPRRL